MDQILEALKGKYYQIPQILLFNYRKLGLNELELVIEVCKRLGIKYRNGGTVFRRSPDEIIKISEICEDFGIKYKDGGTVFQTSPELLVKQIEVYKKS